MGGKQKPHYSSNVNSPDLIPVFINSGTDIEQYEAWLEESLRKGKFIDKECRRRCEECLEGKHGSAMRHGVLEVCQTFFSGDQVCGEAAGKTAAKLLKAICGSIGEIDGLRKKVDELNKALLAAPLAEGSHGPSAQPSRPLFGGEPLELLAIADGVTEDWSGKGSVRETLDALRSARTEDEALNALRVFNDAVRDEFINKNYRKYERIDTRLERLPPLFSVKSTAWEILRGKAYTVGNSEIDRALSTLSRLASSCCQLRRY
jgi:hypothetical protein